jgi:hypothetical protein
MSCPENAMEKTLAKLPAEEELTVTRTNLRTGSNNIARFCMSCHTRLATREILNGLGKKQYRCELCFARKNISGFSKKPKI